MTDREIKIATAVGQARLLKRHINLALQRKDGTLDDFVRRLRMAYNRKKAQINAFTSIGGKLLCIGLVCVLLSGCGATLHGIMVDSEENAGRMRRWSQPHYDKKQTRRQYQAQQDYKARVDLAADIVLADRQR